MNNNYINYVIYTEYVKKKKLKQISIDNDNINKIKNFEEEMTIIKKKNFRVFLFTFLFFVILYILWFTFIYIKEN